MDSSPDEKPAVGGKIPHSHSSPATMDSAAANDVDPKKVGGVRLLSVSVHMLDDTTVTFQLQHKTPGQVLFEQVCRQLHLLEVDYFGMEYVDSNEIKYWLDLEKPMSRQIGLSLLNPSFTFCVKFYTPDPAQLEEEYTRYLFCLQIKRDLSQGSLVCNDNTAALMASYIVQADCGDFVTDDYPDHTYLSSYKFVPQQEADLERRIMENHKRHIGQTPAEADLNLLETARRCELYGVKLHAAKDHEGVPLNLAVAHMGVLVYQNYTKINTFSWAKIRKLSFKRKRFLLKLHPEGYGYYKDTVEFYFDGRNECKNFWKKCVEHHGFFRCVTVKKTPRQKARVISRGSSFRYSGRTQKQVIDYVRDNYIKRQPFQRSQSFRHSSSAHSGVGGPIGQPLLPDTPLAVRTPSSRSCGSVALSEGSASSPAHTEFSVPADTPTPMHLGLVNGDVVDQSQPPNHLDAGENGQEMPPLAEERKSPALQRGDSSPQPQEQIPPQKVVTELKILESPRIAPRNIGNSLQSTPMSHGLLHPTAPVTRRPSDYEVDVRRKRYPTDRAYFIAKEILMTERTYKKDLEVLDVWFRDEVAKEDDMPEETLNRLFSYIDPIYEFHCAFLKEVEQRLATWEGRSNAHLKGDYQKIGDIMLRSMTMLELYQQYLDIHIKLLEEMDGAFKTNRRFQQVYRDFEMQKVCYLPLSTFILKPAYRLLHYRLLLDRLVAHYDPEHPDLRDCRTALVRITRMTTRMELNLKISENLVKLMELQRDMVGIDNLLQPGREFIREGCLQKSSKKGYQQRMFFLFSDLLLYTNCTALARLQFRVYGQLPLHGLMVEDSEPRQGFSFCFTIYTQNRALLLAASCQEEKDKWLEDLTEAVRRARDVPDSSFFYTSLRSCGSSDEVLNKTGQDTIDELSSHVRSGSSDKPAQQRSNTTVHVCWHRTTSVSRKDQTLATQNQLSGYLLRKFKNSNSWQKLWVVFTDFCLFFYKAFQDDFPLASLPLLGYAVNTPSQQDNIAKEYVFKIQFKNHAYFFRAESEYTFSRWMEVISSATQHAARMRLFSRKDSVRDQQ